MRTFIRAAFAAISARFTRMKKSRDTELSWA